jgi:hypothetical protein
VNRILSKTVPLGVTLGVMLTAVPLSTASALATPAKTTTAEQTRVAAIISAGDREISRRLTSLSGLASKINAATRLSASDKSTLSSEVSSEQSGLTALKTKLDAEVTLAGAKTDAQSIYGDYRVYALVVPKVQLVKVADDQQVVESKLTDLALKLQTRLSATKSSGKDVTSLQAQLTDMQTKTQAAAALSSSIEAKVIGLQPSDYNSNHAVLIGDRDQLQTAHADNQAAASDAKAIIAGLKN